jgi:putative transposase
MPRRPRLEFPGALYHVMARGNRKQDIFKGDKGKQRFLEKLSEYKTRYGFMLYAYILMHNHFHLLIETGLVPLAKIMQGVLQSHTQWFNRKHNAVGHLFQGRYKAILCDKDKYLLALVRYLHLNCIEAGFAKDPAKYKWSSHRIFLGLESNDLVDAEFVLSQFSVNRKKAVQIYQEFILDGISAGKNPEFDELGDNAILGDEKFVDDVAEQLGSGIVIDEYCMERYSLDEILEKVSKYTGISASKISGFQRGLELSKARSLFIHLSKLCSDESCREIAKYIGRAPSTLSKIEKHVTHEEFRKALENKELSSSWTINSKEKPDPDLGKGEEWRG